jgi:hypothetical protein
VLPSGGLGLAGVAETGLMEFVSGRASQVALNVVSGRAWDADLWDPLDIALDVVPGVAAASWRSLRASRLQNLDGFTAGDRAFLQGDDLRRALGGFDESGALGRRLGGLDEATAFRLSHLDEFTAGDQALLRGDDLRWSLAGFDESGALSRRLSRLDEAMATRLRDLDVFTESGEAMNRPRFTGDMLRRQLVGYDYHENRIKYGLQKRLLDVSDRAKFRRAYELIKETTAGEELIRKVDILENYVRTLNARLLRYSVVSLNSVYRHKQ